MENKIDPSLIEPVIEQKTETSWIIQLEEDPVTGDLVMPLPTELLESQGWKIGDTLVWDIDEETQTATLIKKK
jgi:hypothetical protein